MHNTAAHRYSMVTQDRSVVEWLRRWTRRVSRQRLLALLVGVCALSGCGDDHRAGHTTTVPPANITGVASKGPLVNTQITLFVLTPKGQRGAQVAGAPVTPPIVTRTDGTWTASLLPSRPGPWLLVATGGSYFDEATGMLIALEPTAEILGLLPQGDATAAITPLTHALAITVQQALQSAAATGHRIDMAGLLTTVIAQATQTFGFDPVRTMPADP